MSAIVFEGSAVNLYVAASLKTALRLYARTGMRVNRAWTPTAMMRKAQEITGQKLAARDYMGAVTALESYLDKADKSGVKAI